MNVEKKETQLLRKFGVELARTEPKITRINTKIAELENRKTEVESSCDAGWTLDGLAARNPTSDIPAKKAEVVAYYRKVRPTFAFFRGVQILALPYKRTDDDDAE